MQLVFIAILGFIILSVGVLVLFFSLRWLNSDELAPRLKTFVTQPEVQTMNYAPETVTRSREITGSIFSRTIVPAFRAFGGLLGRLTPSSSVERLRHQLVIAGNPLGLGPREFYGVRVLFTILALWVSYIILRRDFSGLNMVLGLTLFMLLFFFPTLWLRMMVRKRQDMIRKSLPDALDMLSVCADAGLGFDQAMQRVSEYWDTPISNELSRVVAEMEMGLSRREAMRNMADRLEVSELSSFVSVILQSEQLGMSIADTLQAQAEQMRIERRFRAQEIARTIPIKMLIPLAFLIFPAILAVVLGPAIPALVDLFENF